MDIGSVRPDRSCDLQPSVREVVRNHNVWYEIYGFCDAGARAASGSSAACGYTDDAKAGQLGDADGAELALEPARANRLMKEKTHCEYPHSKTRHLVTNFRVRSAEDGGTNVRANFTVWRTKENKTTAYMAEYRYALVRQDGEIKIRAKRCILDLNTLVDQGRLTIIL